MTTPLAPKPTRRPRVVILGGGYGGLYAALELRKAVRRDKLDVTLVSRDNFFLVQPLLPEAVSGNIEPPHIVKSLRRLLPGIDFHQAEIDSVDPEERVVHIRHHGATVERRIAYDHLLVAVGDSTDLVSLPGMMEHAFPVKTIANAFTLRSHLLGALERAEVTASAAERRKLLTFVVAGAGYTGVEVASEINNYLREAVLSYPTLDERELRVVLLQRSGRILPELSERLAAFSQRILERSGIEVWTNTPVASATAESVVLASGERIPTRTLVSALGAGPNPLLQCFDKGLDARGRLQADEFLRAPAYENTWVAGDAGAIPNLRDGGRYPPTAQSALRQAQHAARNILAAIEERPLKPFLHRSTGVMVTLGGYKGAAEVFGFKLQGFLAWFLFRTFWLVQLPGLDRKLRAMLHWTIELFFKRDIAKYETMGGGPVARSHYEGGQTIFRRGEFADNFYVILSGEVEIYHGGAREATAVLGPGQYFGEMSLLSRRQRSASALARGPVDLLVLSAGDFTALANSSSEFSAIIENAVESRSRANEQRESEAREAASAGGGDKEGGGSQR